jgi:hypothetical protein
VLAREVSEPVAVLRVLSDDRLLCAIGQRVCLLQGNEVVAESEVDESASVSCLHVAGDVLLAGTRLGLHSSRDGARSWESLSSDLSVMALRAASPERVYAVSMGGRLWQIDL